MFEQMRRMADKSFKKSVMFITVTMVICLALCVPYVVFSHRTPIELDSLREDVDWDEILDADEYDKLEGKLVTVKVRYALAQYYQKTGSTSSTDVKAYGYIIYDEESGYMMGVYADPGDGRRIWSQLVDDTNDYFTGYTDKKPKAVTIKGKFRKMTGSELNNYKMTASDCANDIFGTDYRDITLLYTIDTSEKYFESVVSLIFPIFVIVIEAIILLVMLLMRIGGSSIKKVNKYIKKNNLNIPEVESDFATAATAGRFATWAASGEVFVGYKYTYVLEGSRWKMFGNNDLVWVYYTRNTSRYAGIQLGTSYNIFAYHYDKRVSRITMMGKDGEEKMQQTMEYYSNRLPRTVVGYSDELSKEFKKNYNTFLTHKYNNFGDQN